MPALESEDFRRSSCRSSGAAYAAEPQADFIMSCESRRPSSVVVSGQGSFTMVERPKSVT